MKFIIIFALVITQSYANSTNINASENKRIHPSGLGYNPFVVAGFIINIVQIDIFKEIKLAKARERYKYRTEGQRLRKLKQQKGYSEKKNRAKKEERKLRESKLNPLLISKGVKPRRGVIMECLVCGKEKYIRASHFKKSTKYCSKKCYNIIQYKNSRRKCIICEKDFICYPSAIRLRNRKTCSMKCRSKLAVQRGEERRKNQPTVKKNRAIRYSKKFTDWRNAVYKRDNYTCQKCKARSKKSNPVYLEPHHIKQFAFYPKVRFDINNGITLCEKCHKKIRHYHTFEKELLAKELEKEIAEYEQ